jgi:hypothetical protein
VILLALACGGVEPHGGGFDFALTVDGVVAENANGYQVVVLKTGADCGSILSTCVNANPDVSAADFVQITGPDGKQAKAVLFSNTLADDQGSQEATVSGIPPGTGYTVVVEAVSQTDTLLGSSCDKVSEIHSGANSLNAFIHPVGTPAPTCNPLIQ